MSTMQTRLAVAAVATAARITQTLAWGGGNSRTYSTGLYYPNESYDWMYSANNIAMKVEGCVWSTTDDNEDMGCMEDDSGDGTTYWYQMAMCRRFLFPQGPEMAEKMPNERNKNQEMLSPPPWT